MPPYQTVTTTLIPCLLGGAIVLAALGGRFFPSAMTDLGLRFDVLRTAGDIPNAQVMDPRTWAVMELGSQEEVDGKTLFYPPGTDSASLKAQPFHIYHPDFYDVIGTNPTLTRIALTDGDPLFHEAPVWYPPTDEVFFVQNAGAKAAGTGLAKSAIIQKISLSEAAELASAASEANSRSSARNITITTVQADPPVPNPNGATNWRGQMIFCAEGQGPRVPSALMLVNPKGRSTDSPLVEKHNATVLLNNFFGRQFNSVNDVKVHPSSGWVYFTDVDYGTLQEFRAPVNIRRQVYRFCPDTGVVRAVGDYTMRPNGLAFSHDAKYLYVTDTAASEGFKGQNWGSPSGIYKYPVKSDGSLGPAELFTYVHMGVPDGINVDTRGNVYSGCGDGVHVWNPAGELIGKIYTGGTAANFQFAGQGRMVILGETELYYATIGAEGVGLERLG